MKFILKFLVVCGLLFTSAVAEEFSKKASGETELVQEGHGKEFCPVCGMSLKNHYKTSHASHLEDGTTRQYCSIRCLVVDNMENNASLDDVKVVDVKSEKLILAKDAFYVVGSKVPGTMSKASKLAFAKESDAKEFAASMGGEVVGFKEALNTAKETLKEENEARKAMLSKKRIPMGEKIYKAKCKEIDPSKFTQINFLKDEIYAKCGKIEEAEAQSVALYLWNAIRKGANHKVVVSHDDKCPVCGMFPYKYPRWAAKAYYGEKYFAFDGVKDMFKYIIKPEKYGGDSKAWADKIEVTDYYTQNAIDGRKAFYVVGSDVLGPMGNELIPFADESDAKAFKFDHKGTDILTFDEVKMPLICKLDGEGCE